jgi:hypothetical protein
LLHMTLTWSQWNAYLMSLFKFQCILIRGNKVICHNY